MFNRLSRIKAAVAERVDVSVSVGVSFSVSVSVVAIIMMTVLVVLPWSHGTAYGAKKSIETITFATGKDVDHIYPLLLREFMKKNPDIKVIHSELPFSTDDQHNILATKFSAEDNGFDVVSLDQAWTAEFAEAGWLEPLDAYTSKDTWNSYFDWVIKSVTYNNKVYAIPRMADAGMLYYRKDLIKTPPKTWDELIAQCKSNMGKNGIKYGIVFQWNQYEGLVCNAVEFIGSYGGSIMKNGRITINSREAVKALEMMRRLVKEGIAPYGVTTFQEHDSTTSFMQGQTLFMRNWPSSWVQLNGSASKIIGKIGIARIPAGKKGGSGVSCLGGWNLGISKYSKHKKAAWRLLQYLTGAEAQRISAVRGAALPTIKTLYQDREVLKSNPYWSNFQEILSHAVSRPISPLYTSISDQLQNNIHKAITGTLTPKEAISIIEKNLAGILRKK